MTRAPEPWHWWILALGKTIQWLIAYANQPGDAIGGTVKVTTTSPSKEQNENG